MSAASVATPCDWCDAPDVPGFVMWDGNRACADHRAVWYTVVPADDPAALESQRRVSAAGEVCGCEHADHEHGDAHAMFGVPAGTRYASYVGAICDACADGHLAAYVLPGA